MFRGLEVTFYAHFTGSGSLNASNKAPLTYLQSSHNYPTSVPS